MVIEIMLGWSHLPSLFVSTAIIIIYCTAGGLRAIVLTDVIQVSLIIVGMLFIMPPIIFKKAGDILGGGGFGAVWDYFKSDAATQYMTDPGLPVLGGWPYVIGAIILPCIMIGGVAQASFQYQASIQSASKALKSFIMVPFLYIPVSIAVVMIGMCALIIYGPAFLSVDFGGGGQDPNLVLPTLIQDFLPTGLTGLLLAAILSATMSTSSTCLICSTTCFTEDVIKPLLKKRLDDKGSLKLFRISMICIGVLTIGITLWATDIIQLITTGYAGIVAGLWIPMMCTIFVKKSTKVATYTTMIAGLVVYFIVLLVPAFPDVLNESPLYVSLPFSIVCMIIMILVSQKSSHGRLDAYFTDEWEKSLGNWEKYPEIIDGPGPVPESVYANATSNADAS
jgi:SSS family solute:Na+ symporter